MKKLITLCCFLFLCGLLFAQQPPANATALVDNVSFASGMIVGDFDNDGDQDILTRALHNVSGNRILFENTGTDGVFQPPSFFAHEKENLPLALSDFDGPVPLWRNWYKQFYSVDYEAEALKQAS